MAIERKTRLHSIEIADDGTVFVKMKQDTIADGEFMKSEWHRAPIQPDADPDVVIAAVSANLAREGFDAVPTADATIAKTLIASVQTAAVKAAYAAKKAAAEAALAPAPN